MIIEHGTWDYYKPATISGEMPPSTLFAKRAGDDMDWYKYQKTKPFGERSVIMTALPVPEGRIIGAATFDYTAIFPPTALLLEETEYEGSDPQAFFGQRVYDETTKTIGERYVWMPPSITGRQFWAQMAISKLITEDEAVAALGGTLPASIANYIGTLPEAERFAARMFFAAATFERERRAATDTRACFALTAAQMDRFFREASTL